MEEGLIDDDTSVDVIVVGAGTAGYCAAIAAAEQGVSVLLLEKTPAPGGSTVRSGGTFCFAETDEQRAAGISDSPELLRADLTASDPSDLEQIGLFVSRQQETYRRLKTLGISFNGPVLAPGQSIPRSVSVQTGAFIATLNQAFRTLPGSEVMTGAAVTKLLRDANGRAAGVEVQTSDGTIVRRAQRGIVLATGGFARSDETLARFAAHLLPAKRMGGAGCEGDGLRIALELGGEVVDTDWLDATFGSVLPNYPADTAWADDDTILMHANYSGAIIVNKRGDRFVDESLSYRKISGSCLEQPGAVAFQIFDQTIMDRSREEPVTRNFKAALASGRLIKTAGTIAELASTVGLDPENLTASVMRYNASVRAGLDNEFGRTSQIGGQGELTPIDTSPYYIYACTAAIVATYAGLRVNTDMQVVTADGRPIAGLYAAGETTGGFHGKRPVSGTALPRAALTGFLAGARAAETAA